MSRVKGRENHDGLDGAKEPPHTGVPPMNTLCFAGCTINLASGKKTGTFGHDTLMMVELAQEEEHVDEMRGWLDAAGCTIQDILKIIAEEVRCESVSMLSYAIFGNHGITHVPSWRDIHRLDINASRRIAEGVYSDMDKKFEAPEYDRIVREGASDVRCFILDRIMACHTFTGYYAMMKEAARHAMSLYDKGHSRRHSRMERESISEVLLS